MAALYSGGAKTPMGRVDVHEAPVEQEVLIVHGQGDLLSCYAAIWENGKSGLFSKDVPNSWHLNTSAQNTPSNLYLNVWGRHLRLHNMSVENVFTSVLTVRSGPDISLLLQFLRIYLDPSWSCFVYLLSSMSRPSSVRELSEFLKAVFY